MQTFSRRIAFLMPSNQMVPTGGTGQFAKSFVEMANINGWVVDLILDRPPPSNEFMTFLSGIFGQVIYPKSPYQYTRHRETHAFFESYNIEKAANFRDAMMVAFETNIYDMVLVNVAEGHLPLLAMGIQQFIPVVVYTHNANMVYFGTDQQTRGVFAPYYEEMCHRLLSSKNSVTGTQSELNELYLKKSGVSNTAVLPMPLTEKGLLEEYHGEKEGVLFIGRWEQLKNFKEYLRMIKSTGLPARVMTNDTGAKSFVKAFEEMGKKDYDIRVGITGEEKCDFIRSSKVFYMPSLAESYGFSLMECIGHVPSVVLDGLEWHKNFDAAHLHKVTTKTADDVITRLYANPPKTDINVLHKMNTDASRQWNRLMADFIGKSSKSSSAAINSKDDLFYHDHVRSLGRRPGIEDVLSVLGSKGKFFVKYTRDSTWLTKTPGGQPPAPNQEEGSLESFFS